jgi:hypothetical protein
MAAPRESDAGSTDETLGPVLNLANWSLTGISLVFLVLRLYCKAIQRRGLWWDDHFLLASWVGALLFFLAISAVS